jgi:uncharacterized protein YcfL
MMRRILLSGLLAAAAMLTGCSDKAPMLAGPDMPYQNIVFEAPQLKDWFVLQKAVALKRDDNLTEIELVAHNKAGELKTFTYKIDWVDEKGFEVRSILNTRKIASVEPGRNIIIHAISPSIKAVEYKVRLGQPIEADELRDKNINIREYKGE